MTTLELGLIPILLLSWVFLAVSLRYNYVFAIKILGVQAAIEESLDILDERYATLSEILEKPVFFDSPEVRQAIEDISTSRDAILYIANVLAASFDETALDEIE